MKGLLKSGTVRGQQPIVKPNGSSEPIELQRFMHTHVGLSKDQALLAMHINREHQKG